MSAPEVASQRSSNEAFHEIATNQPGRWLRRGRVQHRDGLPDRETSGASRNKAPAAGGDTIRWNRSSSEIVPMLKAAPGLRAFSDLRERCAVAIPISILGFAARWSVVSVPGGPFLGPNWESDLPPNS